MYHTEVIRTSIDRPGIALSVFLIPQGKLTLRDPLYFLLQSAVSDGRATPSNTPKTIVFIDGRRSVHAAAAWAMGERMRLSTDYGADLNRGETCIFNVVRTYTAKIYAHAHRVLSWVVDQLHRFKLRFQHRISAPARCYRYAVQRR
jgi:hypothetical protein